MSKSSTSPTGSPPSPRRAAAALVELFERSGYVRLQDRRRLAALGYNRYKKGAEVRLVLRSTAEVREVERMLSVVGLLGGKPFRKGARTIIPLYGVHAVEWFLDRVRARRELSAAGFAPSGARVRRRQPQRLAARS